MRIQLLQGGLEFGQGSERADAGEETLARRIEGRKRVECEQQPLREGSLHPLETRLQTTRSTGLEKAGFTLGIYPRTDQSDRTSVHR